MAEMKFRSRLQTLPIDLKIALGEISLQRGMVPLSRKKRILELFKDFGVDVTEVGTGTNRTIVKYDGYALKIALDQEGVADNKQEWVMSESLSPYVAQTHEISKGGHLLVASYCPAFTSYAEMWSHNESIKSILTLWNQRGFLLGDVGMTSVNYANWGLTSDGKPVCIDYAYIFPVGMDLFKCICGNNTMTFDGNTFTAYKCTKCNKKYSDRELRSKISPKERLALFERVNGIEMHLPEEMHEVSNEYLPKENNVFEPDPYDVGELLVNMDRYGHF